MEWWLEHGLDGVVGGLLGGMATGLAVWVTIRHERRQAVEGDLRAAVAKLHGVVVRLQYAARHRAVVDWREAAIDIRVEVLAVYARTSFRRWNWLAMRLMSAADVVDREVSRSIPTRALLEALDDLALWCRRWMDAPKAAERQLWEEWDRSRERPEWDRSRERPE